MMQQFPALLGVILAGGLSSRMGQDKSQLKLANKTLLVHIIEKFNAKNIPFAISSNQLQRYNDTAIIKDDNEFKYQGPLAGILAALNYAKKHNYLYILTLAVDTPFIPLNYIDKIVHEIHSKTEFRLAASKNGLEPTFALWPVALLPALHNFLLSGKKKSIHGFASMYNAQKIIFDDIQQNRAFLNINTIADFHKAENWG